MYLPSRKALRQNIVSTDISVEKVSKCASQNLCLSFQESLTHVRGEGILDAEKQKPVWEDDDDEEEEDEGKKQR